MKRFTEIEDDYIRAHYLTNTLAEMGRYLNRNQTSIHGRMKTLGLSVPDEIKKQRHQETIDKMIAEGRSYRFVKGHVPWNKGKKGLNIGGGATRFKPGHKPKNTKKNGAITIRLDKHNRPYYHIRIAPQKWVYLHRYIWEKKKGKIPKGGVIRFKNGNTLDCRIDNLELIDRGLNMKLNSIQNYPPQVQKTLRLIKKIKKHV